MHQYKVPSATAHSLCTLNGGGGGHRLSPDDVCSLGGHSDSSIDSGEFDAHVGEWDIMQAG